MVVLGSTFYWFSTMYCGSRMAKAKENFMFLFSLKVCCLVYILCLSQSWTFCHSCCAVPLDGLGYGGFHSVVWVVWECGTLDRRGSSHGSGIYAGDKGGGWALVPSPQAQNTLPQQIPEVSSFSLHNLGIDCGRRGSSVDPPAPQLRPLRAFYEP